MKIENGMKVLINNTGDLFMTHREYVGKTGVVIKTTKAGLIYVQVNDDLPPTSVPKKNVTPI
jgi:ribosomal protein L21E